MLKSGATSFILSPRDANSVDHIPKQLDENLNNTTFTFNSPVASVKDQEITLKDVVLSMDEDSTHHLFELGSELKNTIIIFFTKHKTYL